MSAQPIDGLLADLRRLGVATGDVLMVHASLRAIGEVEGRAEGVVHALDMAVGAPGTLLMNLSARDDWAWVNDRPERDRASLLTGSIPFDPLRTPSDPDVGVLAEVFRTMPGSLVSDHPEGRFGARGRLAAQLLENAPWDDYYGPGSALERLVEAHGKVLRLSADLGTVTLMHYAEYLADLPTKRRVKRHRLVVGAQGPEVRIVECLDDCDGIVDYPGEDYFAVILREYLATGVAACGNVGRARSELIDARDLVAFAVRWMNEHLSAV
jgi:aminoglycoside N3'-acetyltransferase